MSQDELYEWIEDLGRLIAGTAIAFLVVMLFFIVMGYVYGELSRHPAKATVPDCGSCRIYKEKSK